MREKKIDTLVRLMAAGEWPRALALAARFPRLGEHRDAIVRGHEALANPRFWRSLGKDPDALRDAGIAALQERYASALADHAATFQNSAPGAA